MKNRIRIKMSTDLLHEARFLYTDKNNIDYRISNMDNENRIIEYTESRDGGIYRIKSFDSIAALILFIDAEEIDIEKFYQDNNKEINREIFIKAGRKGGKKSRRKLTPEQAREMARKSAEARRKKKAEKEEARD